MILFFVKMRGIISFMMQVRVLCQKHGGFGFNTLTKEYLTEIGDPGFQMRKVYIESIDKVKDEKVELFLGNHTENNKFFEKLEKLKADPDGENPFINDQDWKEYLEQKKAELEVFSAKDC